MENPTPKQTRTRTEPEPRIIRGGKEFLKVYGISANKQAEMRSRGLACFHNGKYFIYFIKDVDEWIRKNWSIQLPEIKHL